MENDLRKLQMTQLEMLKILNKICEKHDIKLFLNGGTMLGAVRHQGFIPWDDDLDVMLTRKDFDKLEKVIRNELPKEYYYQSIDDKNCGFIFSKIRKNNTLCIEKYAEDIDMHHGIWIDIFVYDNIPNNKLLAFIYYYIVQYYRYMLILKVDFKLLDCHSILIKMIYQTAKLVSKLYSEEYLKKRIKKLMTRYKDKNTKYSVSLGGTTRFYVANEEFNSNKKLKFEDGKYYVTKNPDKYLTDAYGDYMKLPSEEKRVNVHNLDKIVFDTKKQK